MLCKRISDGTMEHVGVSRGDAPGALWRAWSQVGCYSGQHGSQAVGQAAWVPRLVVMTVPRLVPRPVPRLVVMTVPAAAEAAVVAAAAPWERERKNSAWEQQQGHCSQDKMPVCPRNPSLQRLYKINSMAWIGDRSCQSSDSKLCQ